MRILRWITACEAFVDQEETVEKQRRQAREIVYWRTQQESFGYVGTIFISVRVSAPASRFPRGK